MWHRGSSLTRALVPLWLSGGLAVLFVAVADGLITQAVACLGMGMAIGALCWRLRHARWTVRLATAPAGRSRQI